MIDSIQESELSTLKRVQDLTQKYSSYSRTRSGLGNVLGGIVALVVYFSSIIIGPGIITAAIALFLTILWLVGKELIRKKLYSQFGVAQEIMPAHVRNFYFAVKTFMALIVLAVLIFSLTQNNLTNPQGWFYLILLGAMPYIAWRYFRNVGEFMVGVFLLCVCAVSMAGGLNITNAIWLPFIATLMIVIGIIEHRQFNVLKNQLAEKIQD